MRACNFDRLNLCCWRCGQKFEDVDEMDFARDEPDIGCPLYQQMMDGYDTSDDPWRDDD